MGDRQFKRSQASPARGGELRRKNQRKISQIKEERK